MRVLCVKVDDWPNMSEEDKEWNVVVGEWYQVDPSVPDLYLSPGFGGWYKISTYGTERFFPKICFITEQEYRDQQLDKII